MSNFKIKKIKGREILDSKGAPTVEVEVFAGERFFQASAPSGVSAGKSEAIELRDGEERFRGKGVLKAVSRINEIIAPEFEGKEPAFQKEIDKKLIELDATAEKSRLGGNAMVAFSMAVCKAGAASKGVSLYRHLADLSGNKDFFLPRPMVLLMEGGKHGNFATDLQEFMVMPKTEKSKNFKEMLEISSEIYFSLKDILEKKGYSLGVGYEGAFCPKELKSNSEAFELLVLAAEKAGFSLPEEMELAVDGAASEFFKDDKYFLKSENEISLNSQEWISKIIKWTEKYPLFSLEDMLAEEDWESWTYLQKQLGDKLQIVGDDLLTTNIKRIEKAVQLRAVNAVLIKPNQIGTVSETLEAINFSKSAGLKTIISHRGGETNDDFIADLAVGAGSEQCKFGAPARGERVAKYNRLLKIEQELDGK